MLFIRAWSLCLPVYDIVITGWHPRECYSFFLTLIPSLYDPFVVYNTSSSEMIKLYFFEFWSFCRPRGHSKTRMSTIVLCSAVRTVFDPVLIWTSALNIWQLSQRPSQRCVMVFDCLHTVQFVDIIKLLDRNFEPYSLKFLFVSIMIFHSFCTNFNRRERFCPAFGLSSLLAYVSLSRCVSWCFCL